MKRRTRAFLAALKAKAARTMCPSCETFSLWLHQKEVIFLRCCRCGYAEAILPGEEGRFVDPTTGPDWAD